MKSILRKFLYSNNLTKGIMNCRIRFNYWKDNVYPIIKQKKLNPDSVFYVLIPEHGNIGDQAITIATKIFLDNLGIKYIEITDKILFELNSYGFLNFFNNRVIIVHGGGNLGTLWYHVEDVLRNIIKSNNKSDIICLPNTMFYEDSEYGKNEFENSIKVYNEHPSLHLFAREKISYVAMKNAYRNVYLVPDMVLSMDFTKEKLLRKGCLLCFRNDLEKTISDEIICKIEDFAKKYFVDISFTDMCVDKKINCDNRYEEFFNKINEFKSSELVITDRLHAMIFCAITETPCIVINSLSHKVKGCYEWIKDLGYIKFADNIDELHITYETICTSNNAFDNSSFMYYYKTLTDVLTKYCKRK